MLCPLEQKLVKLSMIAMCASLFMLEGKDAKPNLEHIYHEALRWQKAQVADELAAAKGCASPQKDITRCYGNHEAAAALSNDNNSSDKQNDKITDKLLVFVTLTMPIHSLKELLQQAAKYKAVLILRGLKDNSFKQTLAVLQELNAAPDSGFEINPELFARFKIDKVPVFIRIKDDKEIARIAGNISLEFARTKLYGELP